MQVIEGTLNDVNIIFSLSNSLLYFHNNNDSFQHCYPYTFSINASFCLYFVFSLIYFLAYPDRSRYYSSLVLTFAFLATTKYIGQLFWTVSTAALLEANREWPLFPSAEDGICVG